MVANLPTMIGGREVDGSLIVHGFRLPTSGGDVWLRHAWEPLRGCEGEIGRVYLFGRLGRPYDLPALLPVRLIGRSAESHALILQNKVFGKVSVLPYRSTIWGSRRKLLMALGGNAALLAQLFPDGKGGWSFGDAGEALLSAKNSAPELDIRPFGYAEHRDDRANSFYVLRRLTRAGAHKQGRM